MFADAPVARTREAAASGKLAIMVGATEEDFARVRPLLDVMGSTVYHCGDVGTGGGAGEQGGESKPKALHERILPTDCVYFIHSSSSRQRVSSFFTQVEGGLENLLRPLRGGAALFLGMGHITNLPVSKFPDKRKTCIRARLGDRQGRAFMRAFRGFLGVIGLLVALPAAAQDKVTFGTDWKAQAEHGGFYQAVAKGYYAKRGLNVVIRQGGPDVNVPQLLAGGAADFGIGAGAAKFINDLAQRAIQMLQTQGVPIEAREAKFRALLEDSFALPMIGRFVLGQAYRQLSPEEQRELRDWLLEWAAPETPVLAELRALAGTGWNLSSDLAENHDHYLYGTPKPGSA